MTAYESDSESLSEILENGTVFLCLFRKTAERFFRKNGFPGLDGGADSLDMAITRSRNNDCIRLGNELSQRGADGRTVFLLHNLRFFLADVVNGGEFHSVHFRKTVCMSSSQSACTDNSEFKHFLLLCKWFV